MIDDYYDSNGASRRRQPRQTSYIRPRGHGHDVDDRSGGHFDYRFNYEQEDISLEMTPDGPPPPYEEVGRCATSSSNSRLYRQPQQSVPNFQATYRRRTTSASASSANLTKPRNVDVRWEEQPWPSSSKTAAEPSRRDRQYDCPIARSMNRSAAVCDRVADLAARINDMFLDMDWNDDRSVIDQPLVQREIPISNNSSRKFIIDFQKTWLYANSRLPPHMPPMKMYMPTWQLLCMAAQASNDVYYRPRRGEKEDYVEADWRQGTKAMVVKSRPVDDKNVIVLAIRGSKWNPVDWAVNFRPAPTQPVGFLDDEGNACHAGFLDVARKMVCPIAARLRSLLEQDASRASCSLLLTGHSAGGAVASLLYMHMISKTFESELNVLTGCFKRVHCVTFGTPPITFLPLQKPSARKYEKSVFMTFVNEGDFIVRADKQYIATLARLYATPAPPIKLEAPPARQSRFHRRAASENNGKTARQPVWWDVPPATLSNAGRLVLLREKIGKRDTVEAVQVTDEELRTRIFGDPAMHAMELYKRRIDELAVAAVTGRGIG